MHGTHYGVFDRHRFAGSAGANGHRRRAIAMLRLALVIVMGVSVWTAAQAKAQPSVEYLMVPSAAMGRDIPCLAPGSLALRDGF
jgi:hypothetical protein